MEPDELRSLLNEGIQAVKANDRPRARERLLRVLEADDNNEAAWLWLGAALDKPADQLMALERVLAINPRHPQALAGAQALRQRLGPPVTSPQPAPAPTTVEPAAEAEPASPDLTVIAGSPLVPDEPAPLRPRSELILPNAPAATPSDTLLSEDDPFQCAYCGRQTHPDDERCRHCGRGLLVPGPWRGGGYLYFALLITGIQLQLALVQALAAYIVSTYPQSMAILPLGSLWVSRLLIPTVVRAAAWAVVARHRVVMAMYTAVLGKAAPPGRSDYSPGRALRQQARATRDGRSLAA